MINNVSYTQPASIPQWPDIDLAPVSTSGRYPADDSIRHESQLIQDLMNKGAYKDDSRRKELLRHFQEPVEVPTHLKYTAAVGGAGAPAPYRNLLEQENSRLTDLINLAPHLRIDPSPIPRLNFTIPPLDIRSLIRAPWVILPTISTCAQALLSRASLVLAPKAFGAAFVAGFLARTIIRTHTLNKFESCVQWFTAKIPESVISQDKVSRASAAVFGAIRKYSANGLVIYGLAPVANLVANRFFGLGAIRSGLTLGYQVADTSLRWRGFKAIRSQPLKEALTQELNEIKESLDPRTWF